MKYYRILLLLTASLALFSCKKDEEEPIKEPVEGTVLVSGVRVNGVNASLDSETNKTVFYNLTGPQEKHPLRPDPVRKQLNKLLKDFLREN